MSPLSYEALKTRHRAQRHEWPDPNLTLRVHRSLSWLQRAEHMAQEPEPDRDTQFILLWIAFNAAYASDIGEHRGASERELFQSFIGDLVKLDVNKALGTLVWQTFPSSIRTLLDNRFVFEDFWRHHRGELPGLDWQQQFKRANDKALRALERTDTAEVLCITLSRIYTLRNQLVHGGATWHSGTNREQVRDCAAFMAQLVPIIITLLMDHPQHMWPAPAFPVVDL